MNRYVISTVKMPWTEPALSFLVLLVTAAFVTSFTEIYKKEGEDVEFNCTVNSSVTKGLDFIWTMNDKKQNIDNNGKITIQKRNRTEILLLPNLVRTDFGNYSCIYPETDKIVETYVLKLIEPVRIEEGKYTNEIGVAEGSTVKLWCNATSVPPPEIEWYFIVRSKPLRTGIRGPMLGIRDIDRTCPTRFICEASNPLDPEEYVDQTINFSVLYGPELGIAISVKTIGEREFKDLDIEDTDNKTILVRVDVSDIKMRCVLNASPRKEITWVVNDVTAATYNESGISRNESHSLRDKLQFSNTDSRTFELRVEVYEGTALGKYVCKSSNEYGTAMKTIHLKSAT